jgi:hypothetical protein
LIEGGKHLEQPKLARCEPRLDAREEQTMITMTKTASALYVDRATQQWIVRDLDGNFWVVPPVADAWAHRRPYDLADDSELEPVPGHYKYLLEIPF